MTTACGSPGRLDRIGSRVEPCRRFSGVDRVEPDVAQLPDQVVGSQREDALDGGSQRCEVECRRACGRDDELERERRADGSEPREVRLPVVHRVVGHICDGVAARCSVGEDRGDPRDRDRAVPDSAVEVNEKKHAASIAGRRDPYLTRIDVDRRWKESSMSVAPERSAVRRVLAGPIGLVLGAAFLVAACGSTSPTGSPSASGSVGPSGSSAGSPAASEAPGLSAGPSASVRRTLPWCIGWRFVPR